MGRCANCLAPEGRDCPHWIGPEAGIIETDGNGNERLYSGCSCGPFLARMVRYIIQTNNRVAASVESTRNGVYAGLTYIAQAIDSKALPDATKEARPRIAAQPGDLPQRPPAEHSATGPTGLPERQDYRG